MKTIGIILSRRCIKAFFTFFYKELITIQLKRLLDKSIVFQKCILIHATSGFDNSFKKLYKSTGILYLQ